MIKSDFHVHSNFSTDSDTAIESIIEKSISLGLERICITDHMDYCYPSYDGQFELSLDQYAVKLSEVQSKYNNIKILFGIELGLRNEPEMKSKVKQYYDEVINIYHFDFIIGSTHVLYNEDPYYDSFWNIRTSKQTIEDYFQSVIDNTTAYHHFQVYGHLDYIVRYTPEKKYDYQYFYDLIDDCLKTMIYHGKGIELNTSGYRYQLNHPHPRKEIFKRYLELGGEIVTIGSDAHSPEDITSHFNKAEELLKELGYQYYTVYEKQKPYFIKL